MSIKGGKLDFLHKSKIVEGFLGETKPSTAAYINVREERRRVSTTKSPTRLTYTGSLFITFEGGEGCGKSTQSNMLSQYLLSQNVPTDLTREVGGTIVAEKMRDILVYQDLLPMSEMLQVMAARYEHVHKRIIPKLNSGVSVICDRFVDSTACYQGQEVGTDLVYELHKSLISPVMPDITFFIDIEPNIALARACARGNNNKFENKNIEFHQKVYNRFQYISDKFPDRIVKINASALSANEIHDIIVVMLTRKLEKTI